MRLPFSRKPVGPRPLRICPHCGSSFPQQSLACPECGSDENTGWKSDEEIQFESLDLGEHTGGGAPLSRGWRLLILAVVVVFVLSYVLVLAV